MPNATSPQARSKQNAVDLRLDLVQKLGPNFVNPVQSFIATNGPAKIGGLVKFSIFLNEGVEQVQVLRNTARDVASASVLQSYDAQNVPLHQPVSYYDSDTAIVGRTAFYWLRSTPQNKQLQPIVAGPIQVSVPQTGDSSLLPPNEVSNSTNFATVDSVSDGGAATVRVYGTGGLGSAWTRSNGDGTAQQFPSGQVSGLSYATVYQVFWNGTGYQAFPGYLTTLPDNLIFAGKVTTLKADGTGGSIGGGGAIGGVGGNRLAQQNVSAGGPLLETNGVENTVQDVLNLTEKNSSVLAPNIILTDAGTGEVDLTVPGDSLIHGDAIWEIDPAYVFLRDDFVGFSGTGGNFQTELGWAGSFTGTLHPSAPPLPACGAVAMTGNGTASDVNIMLLMCNQSTYTQDHFHQAALPLFDTAGWKVVWTFLVGRDYFALTQSAATTAFSFTQAAFYLGLGNCTNQGSLGVLNVPRPPYFCGLRFDTDPTAPAIGDRTFKFECVSNLTIATTRAGLNPQGNVTDTGMAPTEGHSYRLEILSTVAGTVVMTLIDGTAGTSFSATLTVPQINSSSWLLEVGGGNGVGYAQESLGSGGNPFGVGGKFTLSGLAGGAAVFNGTWTALGGTNSRVVFLQPNTFGLQAASGTVVGYPVMLPYAAFGNDSSATPVANSKAVFLDFFALAWNPSVGAGAGAPDKLKARYF